MKKMFMIVCCVLLLAGCGLKASQDLTKAIDCELLAAQIAETGLFEGELNKQSGELAEKMAGLDGFELSDIVLYVSSGALSEKILIVQAETEEIKSVQAYLEKENAALQKSYASYNPNEVVKLADAVMRIEGNTLIYCVSTDADAIAAVIDAYLK